MNEPWQADWRVEGPSESHEYVVAWPESAYRGHAGLRVDGKFFSPRSISFSGGGGVQTLEAYFEWGMVTVLMHPNTGVVEQGGSIGTRHTFQGHVVQVDLDGQLAPEEDESQPWIECCVCHELASVRESAWMEHDYRRVGWWCNGCRVQIGAST